MAEKKGMDPEAVKQMAQSIRDAGEEAQSAFDDVKGKVDELDWTGEDRDDYVSQFEDLADKVKQLKQKADDFAESAEKNAKEQTTASSH